jgi:hypothetical protein
MTKLLASEVDDYIQSKKLGCGSCGSKNLNARGFGDRGVIGIEEHKVVAFVSRWESVVQDAEKQNWLKFVTAECRDCGGLQNYSLNRIVAASE